MAEPAYGAMYLKPAGSEAGALTMVVYYIAPVFSRFSRTSVTVEFFWPTAT